MLRIVPIALCKALLEAISLLPVGHLMEIFCDQCQLYWTNISLQHPDSDTSSSDKSSASGKDSDDSANFDNASARKFGWAEVGRCHSVHPSFSQEPKPSLVYAIFILTPDFKFQYSHNNDDMNAKQALAFDNPLSNESALEGAQHVSKVSELSSQLFLFSEMKPVNDLNLVEGAAAGLKAGSKFLHDGVDEQFVCVLDGLIKNGSRQSFTKFTAKEYGLTYKSALKSL
ncbi:uncharacterized protein F5147DRAFT_650972 [Suillus discolor]|uniref:Uncharacterized protein n=1 Tax=Suillus discolor TaxID=1912936 RepID=A0A9P7JWF5_9AGAM|nr:uncharacterized protein F5147DRAFT_650972 [Suillus discolor]KAG2112341.1 hypothetical protein F5147DRAFT_650972 [Suillus discolor]